MAIVKARGRTAPTTINDDEGGSGIDFEAPRATDFVAPRFFFSSRLDSTIERISPSVSHVLGFEPQHLPFERFESILCRDCPLNADESAFRRTDLRPGQSIHALRSVRDHLGDRKVLSIQSVGIATSLDDPIVRHHHIAEDVTESVECYVRTLNRLNELSERLRRLSDQETQVAQWIRQGKMNREIADEMSISERTVDRRRATILKRLDVGSAAEMVAMLVERSMLNESAKSLRTSHWCQARNSHRVLEAL